MAEITDLERRLTRLEGRFDELLQKATQREEDWGTVRSNAERAANFAEEIRELRRTVERLASGNIQVSAQKAAPESRPAPPPPTAPAVDMRTLTQQVLSQLRSGYIPTEEDVRRIVTQAVDAAVSNALSKLNLDALADRIYKDVGTASVEEKIAKYLEPRLRGEVDARQVAAAVTEKILQSFLTEETKKALLQQVADRIASKLSITTGRGY